LFPVTYKLRKESKVLPDKVNRPSTYPIDFRSSDRMYIMRLLPATKSSFG
jgi:hypothetical protein